MTDTYDAQIKALLTNDTEAYLRAIDADDSLRESIIVDRDEISPDEDTEEDRDEIDGLFFSTWSNTATVKSSLFADLPGLRNCCASQIDQKGLDHMKLRDQDAAFQHRTRHEFWRRIHEGHPERLDNPKPGDVPTREVLEEFARRQRICRDIA